MIPVVVGVTGHRNLIEQDIEKLRESVRGELESIRLKCPDSPLVVMTSLAEGADQLCAEIALEMGLILVAVLPMDAQDYAGDFEAVALERFERLMDDSDAVFVSPEVEEYDERYGSERDWRYRQAGLYVAGHSHVLMALWDGSADDETGCGTASIVKAALENSIGKDGLRQLHPENRAVIQIETPRGNSEAFDDITYVAGEVRVHGDSVALESILRTTDLFNRDVRRRLKGGGNAAENKTFDMQNPDADPVPGHLKELYNSADVLSILFAEKHRKYLGLLSTSATLLAMAFLIYDEADWYWMIAVCGIIIVELFALNIFHKRSRYQARYLEYRVLAEALRVQIHLREAGIALDVSNIMPWNLQVAMPWLARASSAAAIDCNAAAFPEYRHMSVKESWIVDQRDYHRGALTKTKKKLDSNDRILRAALVLTLAVYALALVFELYCGGLSGGRYLFSGEVNETIRMYIKIAMGTFSAGTLFVGNYYGKQALPNVIDDHRKMAVLYEEALHEIERQGETEDILVELARDELNENANWYAYQSKNEPDLGI